MKRLLSLSLAALLALAVSCNKEVTSETGGSAPAGPVTPEGPTGPVVSKGAYKHVVIIGVDGGGAFFMDTPTPQCDRIFKDQATTYRSLTSFPTISAQCWTSMLHGVLPEFHGITNNIASDKEIHYPKYSLYPSIFRIAREAMPGAELGSFVSWNAINNGIVDINQQIYKFDGDDDDNLVTRRVVEYLQAKTPTVLFVQFDLADIKGELKGFGSKEHLEAITLLDGYIGWIYDQLALKGILDETLFLVTADHGGINKGHGGDTDQEKYVFLGVSGKTVQKGTIVDVETRDVAAIAAYALGLEIPDTWTGRVPAGLFQDVKVAEARNNVSLPGARYRSHATAATPTVSKMQSLLSGHTVKAYMPFDGNLNVSLGSVTATKMGTLNYYDAYFGKGVALNNGYVKLSNMSVGTQSFSVSCWLKASAPDSDEADPGIVSNKDWDKGKYKGFILSLRGTNDIKFNVGDGENNRMDFTRVLPTDFANGWMHVVLTVDRPNRKVRIYYDFICEDDADIPDSLADISFDSLSFNIGQDGTGNLAYSLPAQIDELIITADVLTDQDVAALQNHYTR